jgi:hypothetical protein
MTLADAYDFIDVLVDKADQAYFTNPEKDMFIELAISEYINKHYKGYEFNQQSRDALWKLHNTAWTLNPGGEITIPSDYMHALSLTSRQGSREISYKFVSTLDYWDRVSHADYTKVTTKDPFNNPYNTPIAVVDNGQYGAFINYFPQINFESIQAIAYVTNVNVSGEILSITMVNFGLGYTTATASIVGTGTGASLTPTLSSGSVVSIDISSGGTGYSVGDTITISAPDLATASPEFLTLKYIKRPTLNESFDGNLLNIEQQHEVLKSATRMLTATVESSNYEVQQQESQI